MKRSCAVLLTVVSLMLPTLAAGKDHAYVVRDPWTDEVIGQLVVSCDGFDVLADYAMVVKLMEYYDGSNELVKWQGFLVPDGRGVYYNSVNPEHSVLGMPGERETDKFFVAGDRPRALFAGPLWMVTVPGYGVIFAETGRFVIDLTTGEIVANSGWNQLIDQDGAALCDYLK
jgi:hypothetical protein